MLLDFDLDQLLICNRPTISADQSGLQSGPDGAPAPNPTPNVFQFNGRISGISGKEVEEWKSLGIDADAELFTLLTGPGAPGQSQWLQADDSITFDDGVEAPVTYRIVGRSRRVAKGTIQNYFKFPLQGPTFG